MVSKALFLSIPYEDARNRVAQFFTQSGWRVTPDQNGNFRVERGNRTKTFWLGAFAADDMYVSHYVDFSANQQGGTNVIYSTTTGSGIMGGVIGVNRSSKIHTTTWPLLANALHAQGVLLGAQ
ncbi:hypothetical protein [Actinomyces trachealis]|uniref:hypothetical protein n=1 Tax=Actinomyces trachealis TaxID=2763540 RepID=UPI001892B0C9|nr:hypothetical protein [Actinomyces trachealis]